MLTAEIRLAVFDWAGTTIDFGCLAPAGAFIRAFAERGVTVTLAETRGPMGLHKKEHIRKMFQTPSVAEKWRAVSSQDWTEADVEDLYQLVTPMQIEAAKLHSTLVPGTVEAMAHLRSQGIKIAATTGYFHAAAEVCYEAGRQQGYEPDFSICADEVPSGRPAPWMIFRAMEALGVYPATQVVKIGDTAADIREGLNAGAWSVGIVDSSSEMGLTPEELAALSDDEREARREVVRSSFLDTGADATIDTFADLPDLITALNEQLR